MIRNLLATTAIATLVASGAYAQTTTPPATGGTGMQMEQAAPNVIHAEGHLASNVLGQTVYNGQGDEAENIGEVNDLVLSDDGTVEAIVVGVGGFLGIGEKRVALEYDLVQWAERDGDRFIVVETTREALEAQEEFDVAAYRPLPADAQVGNTEPATAEDLGAAPVESEQTAEAPADDATAEQDMAGAPADDQAQTEEDMAAAPADDQAESEADVVVVEPTDDAAGAEEDMAAAPADDQAQTEEDMAAAPADTAGAEEDMAAAPADDTTAGAEQDVAAAPADDQAESEADVVVVEPTDDPAAAEEETAAAPVETDETQTAAIDRSNLADVNAADISAEEFIGTTVYGAGDENIGEIGDILLSEEGETEAILVNVGGFLGIGEKTVAIGMDNLAFLQDEDGSMYLYTEFTQEQLEAQPAYDEATYAENRDEQLLTAQ